MINDLWVNVGLWVNIGLGLICATVICSILAVGAQPLRETMTSFFAIFHQPFLQTHQTVVSWLKSLKMWFTNQFADESATKGEGPVYFIIGSLLYTILTVVFLLCDFGMLVLTAEAIGMDTKSFQLPIDTSTLTAATLVTAGLFWGSIVLDLVGVTRIGPWKKALSPLQHRILMWISAFFIFISIILVATMAYYRAESLWQAMAPEAHAATEGVESSIGGIEIGVNQKPSFSSSPAIVNQPQSYSSRFLLLGILMGIAILSGASTVFSAVGAVILFKFIFLLIIAVTTLPLLPVAFVTWFCSSVIYLISLCISMLVNLMIHYGNCFLGLFGRTPKAQTIQQRPESQTQVETVFKPQNCTEKSILDDGDDLGFNPFSRIKI